MTITRRRALLTLTAASLSPAAVAYSQPQLGGLTAPREMDTTNIPDTAPDTTPAPRTAVTSGTLIAGPGTEPGAGVQRAMTLMATSTPTKRNTVRVLFYGQSITEQEWWKMVAEDLRQRFPHADLIIENHAIGGFASQLLVRDAEAALYPWYPDLVIFHVYGAHDEYENIIRRLRERTTADILLQTDHVTQDNDLNEETNPANIRPDGKMWNSFMNYSHLPAVAKKYGAGLVDVRGAWKDYLREKQVPASSLLKDGVHLNEAGCVVMAALIKPYLVYRPELPADAWRDRVKTLTLGKEITWQGNHLQLDFVGNRVDLLPADTLEEGETFEIRLDGKKPSEIPELYTFTRTTVYPGTPWPGVMRIQWEKPLQLEDWTLRITEQTDDLKKISFALSGSKTGPDGTGTNTEKFVSNSGRVVIEPDDWSLSRSRNFTEKALPEGFVLKFAVVPLFQDTWTARGPRTPAKEEPVTVAGGLTNGPHTLGIIASAGNPQSLKAVRIYKP